MASKTTNYKLHKIDSTDAPPDITTLNQNWDILDDKLKELDSSMTDVKESVKNIDLSHKADLVNGKIPVEQLPEFSTVEGVTAVLSTTWNEQTDGSFSQSVTVNGVATDSEVIVDCNLTGTDIDADVMVMEAWGCVNRATQATNSLTFYCYGFTPTIAIPINVVVM